jgi:hypothetical protein
LSTDHRNAACLFESDDEQLAFMEDRVLDQQMAQFLIYKKRFNEAADIYLGDNDTNRAIETLLHPEYTEGADRARHLLIKELWMLYPMQCEKKLPTSEHQLIALANKIVSDKTRASEVPFIIHSQKVEAYKHVSFSHLDYCTIPLTKLAISCSAFAS